MNLNHASGHAGTLQSRTGPGGMEAVSNVPVNFFRELGVKPTFALDLEELEQHYLERSKERHPDRFVNAAASERVAALSSSMTLNEAYKVLKSARKRAEHLLNLHGVTIDGVGDKLDPAFLLEILEAREELAEAQVAGDFASVARLEEAMLDRRDASLATIASRWATVEASGEGSKRASELLEIKRELIVLRYVDRYLEAAVEDD